MVNWLVFIVKLMQAAMLSVFAYFVWLMLSDLHWAFTVLAVLAMGSAVWLQFTWWLPKEAARKQAIKDAAPFLRRD